MDEFHYRVAWRARGQRPGRHAGSALGAGLEFTGHAPLRDHPDPRRLDVRASVRDARERWLVRVFRQRAAIAVWLLADVSASMAFAGSRRKLDVLADFAAAAGHSAFRSADAFGLLCCDGAVREDLFLPARHQRAAGATAAHCLRSLAPQGRSAAGLALAAPYLGRARALVFLASDFHFELALLERVLEALAHHAVVPLLLWDEAEYARLPEFGLAELADAESGRRRSLLLRPSLRRRWEAAFRARREALAQCFADHHVAPLVMTGAYSAEAVTAHFYAAPRDAPA